MALSNMLNEPRREITETVVGIAVVVPFAWLDYYFACGLWESAKGTKDSMPFVVALFFTAFTLAGLGFMLVMFLLLVHGLGDIACNALERRGFQLRPRQRFQRKDRG